MSNNEYSELINFLGKKFDGVDEKFDSIDKKFDAIDKKFDAIDKKFDAIDKKFDAIDKKFDAVDEQFETMRREIGVQFEAMDHKIDLLIEGMVGANQTAVRNKEENDREHARLEKMSLINAADISNLDKRVERLEQRPGR